MPAARALCLHTTKCYKYTQNSTCLWCHLLDVLLIFLKFLCRLYILVLMNGWICLYISEE